MAMLACLGGLFFRFIPTTIAFLPARKASYFPATPELLMTVGYIALGIAGFRPCGQVLCSAARGNQRLELHVQACATAPRGGADQKEKHYGPHHYRPDNPH